MKRPIIAAIALITIFALAGCAFTGGAGDGISDDGVVADSMDDDMADGAEDETPFFNPEGEDDGGIQFDDSFEGTVENDTTENAATIDPL